jgi:pyruvate-formate lyase-activating enzyme
VEEVVDFLSDPSVSEVYLGGAEPTVQRKELEELLLRLSQLRKKVFLKTNGADPGFIGRTASLVDMFVIEVKCPLDDLECYSTMSGMSPERTERYLGSLRSTLEQVRGKEVRIWIRVMPGFSTLEAISRIGQQIAGTATEVHLYQFLSSPENDAPFLGIDEPGPGEEEMMALAEEMLKYVPRVMVQGKSFRAELKTPAAG